METDDIPMVELELSTQALSTAYSALSQAKDDDEVHYPFDGIASKLLDATEADTDTDDAVVELSESRWLIVYGTITTATVGDDLRISHIEQQAALTELSSKFPDGLDVLAEQVDIAATNMLDSEDVFDDADL